MAQSIVPTKLRCEYLTNPIGIDAPAPRLSWQILPTERAGNRRGHYQSAYRIRVANTEDLLAAGAADLWDSGKVTSAQTLHIAYDGTGLRSYQRAYWDVQVWDAEGVASGPSTPAFWQAGIMRAADWVAQWISTDLPRYHDCSPPVYLRRSFEAPSNIKRAILTTTSRGVYQASINGERVGDCELAPGWTEYATRIAYQTYDVTDLIHAGENAIGTILGDGWYSGYVGFLRGHEIYGTRPELLAQLTIEEAGGSVVTISTDENWRASYGPIQFSDMLMGEFYDARLEIPGWSAPGFDSSNWTPVILAKQPELPPKLVAQTDPPVRITESLPAKSVAEPIAGTFVYDMGQNFAGKVRLSVTGSAGRIVRLRFAEMLNPDGTAYLTNLRAAKATDTYVLKGSGVETFLPTFTFHGFRYVEVTGYPLANGQWAPPLEAITGYAIESDTPPAGSFECSHPMVNQLYRNIMWGQRGNFLSIPTDCPQRDERCGWAGDAQIFVRTATYNRDVASFYTKWIQDIADSQKADGSFLDICPTHPGLINKETSEGAAAYADAGVIVPWTIGLMYGDDPLLERKFESVRGWVDYLEASNPDLLWRNKRGYDYGDWLSIKADTDKELLATAYFAYDTSLVAKIAKRLGKTDEAEHYFGLFERIKSAFNEAYVNEDGTIKGDTQTTYVLALRFNLLPQALRVTAAKHLADNIRALGNHLSTGFVGVGYLCPVLSDNGYNDLAYTLLLNETFPSWGYSVKHGATTIWERWDGWTEENGFQTHEMNSFNHYSFGSIGEWLFRYAAGIDADESAPGFERIAMHPRPDRRLKSISARYDSIRGQIVSNWRYEGSRIIWDIVVPANTSADVILNVGAVDGLLEGDIPIDQAFGITLTEARAGQVSFSVVSGRYSFCWPDNSR